MTDTCILVILISVWYLDGGQMIDSSRVSRPARAEREGGGADDGGRVGREHRTFCTA
jgi:hypothetical protein